MTRTREPARPPAIGWDGDRYTFAVTDSLGWSQPVKWWRLISVMEDFRSRTGMGLAGTWGLVHAGDYRGALESFLRTVNDFARDHPEVPLYTPRITKGDPR